MLFVEGATGQDSSGAPSTNASRLSVGQELAWHRRGVRVKDLKKLVDDAKGILNLDEHHCATSNFNVGSSVEVRDGLFRVQLHTDRDHRLYRFDRVAVHAPEEDAVSTPEEGRSARSGLLRTSHRRFGAFPIRRSLAEHIDVVNVLSPRSVEVEVTRSQFSALAWKTLSMPLNMHKLAGEMLIPLTTVEERVVHIRDSADAQLLIDSLNPDKKTVQHNLMLPAHGTGGLIQISQGMAIHGSLSTRGTIRRYYWSLDDRSSMWHTRIFEAGAWHHGRTQSRPDEVPRGVAEAEQWIGTDTILERASNGGVLLVLRRGVSFSELLHKGHSVTEFISHNWCQSSVDLIRTLQTASVRWAWICTFALNQHAVPCLSSGIESSPFYQAMQKMSSNGRVIMVLDEDATTLTRIWCVFEVWVSQSLRLTFQMFLPSGELNFFGTDEQSRKVKRRLVTLHLTDAECSVEEDKEMILRLIDESDGGRAAVAWQVKRTMSASAVVFLLLLLGDTSAFFFAVPLIWGMSHDWVNTTLFKGHWLSNFAPFVFVFFSGSFYLRHWRRLANPSNVVTTLSALWAPMLRATHPTQGEATLSEMPSTRDQGCQCCARRQSVGTDQGFVAGFLTVALLEMVCVLALIANYPWRNQSFSQGIVHVLICSEHRGRSFCVLLTLYLLLKTFPWVVGLVMNAVQQGRGIRPGGVRMKDFLVASPRIGFLIALLSLTVISVRQEVGGVHSPCCHKEGVACDLTHLPLARKGEVTLSFFLIGLGAWGASVVCSFGIAVHGFAKSQGLLRRLLEVLVFLSAVVLLVGLIILHKLSFDLATHMDLGVAVWTIASVLFHGKDLCATFSSNFARIAHRHGVVADVRHDWTIQGSLSLASFEG